MNADDLRAVAAEIRGKAKRATNRRTWVADGYDVFHEPTGDRLAEFTYPGDAGHFVAWNPAVALAVADWLDAVANNYGDATIDRRAEAFVKAWRAEP